MKGPTFKTHGEGTVNRYREKGVPGGEKEEKLVTAAKKGIKGRVWGKKHPKNAIGGNSGDGIG